MKIKREKKQHGDRKIDGREGILCREHTEGEVEKGNNTEQRKMGGNKVRGIPRKCYDEKKKRTGEGNVSEPPRGASERKKKKNSSRHTRSILYQRKNCM